MNNISKLVIIGSVAITLSSCGDSWLEPKPLSFYSPENTLVDAKGMWAALGTCEKRIKAEFYGDGPAIITEHIFQSIFSYVMCYRRIIYSNKGWILPV